MPGHNAMAPLDRPTVLMIQRLRRQRLTVLEIGQALGRTRASDFNAIQLVCDSVGRRYGMGDVGEQPMQRVRTGKKGSAP